MLNRISNILLWKERLDWHMGEIVQGAFVAFVLRGTGAVLGFGFNLLLARMLGAQGAGIFFLALALTMVVAVLSRLGMDNTILRFTASHSSSKDWSAVKGTFRQGLYLALGISCGSTVVLFLAAPWLAEAVLSRPELTLPIRWMALSVIPLTALMLHAEALRGLKRIRDSQLVNGVALPAFSFIGLLGLGRLWGVQGAVLAYLIAAVCSALLGIWLWYLATRKWRVIRGLYPIRPLLRSCLPLWWVACMNLLMVWTSTILLGFWHSAQDVGAFHIALRTAMLISFILLAVNSIAAPKFSALHRQGDRRALQSTARGSALLMTLLAVPLALLFILSPGWVMNLFGPEFSVYAPALSILAFGEFINIACGSVGYLLIMSGNERVVRNNNTLAAFLNVVLNLVLIPLYGVLGAAFAVCISVSLKNILGVFLVKRHLGFMPLGFSNFGAVSLDSEGIKGQTP